jgi:hypothetical protein
MAVSIASIQVGKSYLFEPGGNVRRVVGITSDGKIEYIAHSATDGGGSAKSIVTMSLDRFARDAVCEVPSDGR